MKKAHYKNYMRTKGAFGFCLRPAGSKFTRQSSPNPDTGRLEGRLGIKPMGLAASMFAGARHK